MPVLSLDETLTNDRDKCLCQKTVVTSLWFSVQKSKISLVGFGTIPRVRYEPKLDHASLDSTTVLRDLGLIKFMNILLLIFDDPGGTRSATGLRDIFFPMWRINKANYEIALNQKLSHSCEILKYVGLNFVLLTCESAVQGIITLTIHNQCQNYSMVIASLRYTLPAGGAVVEPTKWINRGPSKI